VFSNRHLRLKMVRLKPAEEWVNDGKGLSFIFPKGGVAKYVAETVSQRLVPGDVLILNSEPGGKLHAASGGELIFWQFSVAFENLFPLFTSNEICLMFDVVNGLKSPTVHSGTNNIAKECHKYLDEVPPDYNLEHRSQLLRVVGTILTEEFKKARTGRVGNMRAADHLVQVFERLSVDELLTASVGELATRFGCSRRHLSRLFHQHFGFSMAALRMELRLLKAVSLLKNPDAKIINVAEESGFNHLGLFSTCFRKRFGNSPGQWRKMNQQPKEGENLMPNKLSCPLRTTGLCPGTDAPGVCEIEGQTGKPNDKPTVQSPTRFGNGEATMVEERDRAKLSVRVRFQPKL
jgi:AraC-like DNA-binding protein